MGKEEVITRLAIAIAGRVIGNAISDMLWHLWQRYRNRRPKHMR